LEVVTSGQAGKTVAGAISSARLKKRLQGPCQHCGGTILFVADAIGTTATCPHCGDMTELTLERPPEQPTIPRRVIVWTVIAVLILLGGLAASFYALKRAQNWSERQKHPPATQAQPAP
jgi:predicted secreted protein